jgi:hypothetical protein
VKRSYFILFLIFLLSKMYSQSTNSNPINQTRILSIREAKFTLNYNDVEGSAYYTKDFIKSVAYLKDGNYASIPLRYDIFRDEIEFQRDNRIFWLKKSDVNFVRYGSEMLILTHSVSDTSQLGYFFLNGTGNYKLLCKKTIGFYPEVPPKGYGETVPAKFKREPDEFYIQSEGKPAFKIRSKNDLLAIFASNKPALDYIKKEKIRITRTQDLQNLIDYLNKE